MVSSAEEWGVHPCKRVYIRVELSRLNSQPTPEVFIPFIPTFLVSQLSYPSLIVSRASTLYPLVVPYLNGVSPDLLRLVVHIAKLDGFDPVTGFRFLLDSSIDELFRQQRRPTHDILNTSIVPASMAGETDFVREAITLLLSFASPGAVQFHLSHFPLAQHPFPFQSRFPAITIAFLGLLMKVAPFPLVEAQARAALHVFAHLHELDVAKETADIVARYEQLRAELQTEDPLTLAKAWHVFKGLEQFNYRDELYAYTAPSFGGDAIVVPQ
ncbi:hypothetical protein EV421DRAFT_1908454 [Armillaria borealis]|uniref:Uncharacterized protein n=1 Tax=Armillaria borealis TaxID=47425 RepID=A0AA39J5L9_9AGAR|nr:hypothetical protein EV421DRAFT_1908454 [Armillaria borealis]